MQLFKSKKQEPKNETDGKVTVEQIHNEFYSAADKLVEDAKRLVNEQSLLKASRLRSLGFEMAREVTDSIGMSNLKIASQNVSYYKDKYPLYKFIDEETVRSICKKYGLACAGIERYLGVVPEKNLKQIEEFKVDETDCIVYYYASQRIMGQHKRSVTITKEQFDANTCDLKDGEIGFHKDFRSSLQICAPEKEMKLYRGEEVENGRIVNPDPVVLKPVIGGYLIVTAWGDEASDPLVVNEINN